VEDYLRKAFPIEAVTVLVIDPAPFPPYPVDWISM